MLISLLLSQSAVYCRLSHFAEAGRCCDAALRLTERCPEVYYRRSQVTLVHITALGRNVQQRGEPGATGVGDEGHRAGSGNES